ncbi:M16 family metallopeptidase [Chloroflexota bacterium]
MYDNTTLDNGLRIVTAAMPHTRSVSLSFFIGVGSRYETKAEAGISHFIEHLCFKGTPKHPTAREISEAIEGVGGILNGGTDKELTVYWCKVAQSHLPRALDVLVDMLLHSKFDPEDITRERQIILEEINMSKDSPSQRVDMLIDELLWPNHPLGRDIAGNAESVTATTRHSLLNYAAHHYQPSNTVIAVAGDIQHQEVTGAISQALGHWTNQQPRPGYTAYNEQPNPRLHVETRDTEQAHLCLALPGLSLFHPKRFTLDLLNVILGEGMSSRLFTEIRDKLGLAYSIHSYVDHLHDSGSVTIYAGVEPKNLQVAIKAILEQLDRFKEVVPQSELSKAKELAKGRLLLRLEDSRNVASWLGGQEILTGQILTVDQVVSIIEAITADDVKQLAEELLVSSQLRLAVVGPIASDQPLDELLRLS